jgi:Cu/Ag efflux protein CusF
MTMISMRWRLLAAGFALALTASAHAQQPQTVRARGTIEKVDGTTLDVKLRDGTATKLKLKDNPAIGAVVPAKLSDIQPGSAVGVTSIPQADGSLKAYEVHIFPPQQRVNEGHTPYDTQPNSQMTNGRVETSVASVNDQVLTVTYKQGDKTEQKKITVTPQTIFVTTVPGNKDDLKPGAQFVVFRAAKNADGTLAGEAIAVGRGIAPPM